MGMMVYSLLWVMQDLYHQPVDDINPALPIIRNILYFRKLRVTKVMQDLYHQQYDEDPIVSVLQQGSNFC